MSIRSAKTILTHPDSQKKPGPKTLFARKTSGKRVPRGGAKWRKQWHTLAQTCHGATLPPMLDVGLIRWTARRLGRSIAGLEDGDILGEGAIGLLQAERTFDPSLGAWSTFAVTAVRRRLLRAARRARAPVTIPVRFWEGAERGPAEDAASMPGVDVTNVPYAAAGGPDGTIDDALALGWVRSQLGSLPPRVAQVIAARLDGATLEDIGAELGVSREWARQLEAEGIRVLRKRAAS